MERGTTVSSMCQGQSKQMQIMVAECAPTILGRKRCDEFRVLGNEARSCNVGRLETGQASSGFYDEWLWDNSDLGPLCQSDE